MKDWVNKTIEGLDEDNLDELSIQKLVRIENGKQTISQNSSFEGRQKGGITNKETGHIQSLGKKWGSVNVLKGGTTQEIRLMGAQAMKEKTSTPIYQMDMDGNILKEWESINNAKRAGYHAGHISNCCNGLKPQYKGFLWKFKK